LASLLPKLQYGQVIWGLFRDPHGFRKHRPAIVLTPTNEIAEDVPIVVMCVTTTFPEPPPARCIPLPWNPDPRRVATGLAQRSAAVLDWFDTMYPDEIEKIGGRIPAQLMSTIQRLL